MVFNATLRNNAWEVLNGKVASTDEKTQHKRGDLEIQLHVITTNSKILTLQPKKLTTSNSLQNSAKHTTAVDVICLQPLLMKVFSLGQPRASASTPFSVMALHQLIFMWVNCRQPSLRAFSERSEIAEQLSRFNLCSLLQCVESAWHVTSVSFLQPLRLRSSTLGQEWASDFMEPSAMDWQPRRDSCRRKPPHLRDIFSITWPWNNFFSNESATQLYVQFASLIPYLFITNYIKLNKYHTLICIIEKYS